MQTGLAGPAGPIVIVNYKTYPQTTGEAAVAVTRALEAAVSRAGVGTVAVAPQAADLWRVSQATRLPALGQHVDPITLGLGTGATTAEALKGAGAAGSLLNHAEKRLQLADLSAAVTRLHGLGMWAVACTNDVATTRAAAALAPAFVAIEPPELIGGDVSVTTADPGIVRDSVAAARAVNARQRVLCGAGVKTGEDVRAALALGCDGVLLASGVTKAKEPGAALAGLLSGLR